MSSYYATTIFLFAILVSVFLTFKSDSYRRTKYFYALSFLVAIITIWLPAWFFNPLISLSGDAELNPGPKRVSISTVSTYHWYLNRMSAQNLLKCLHSLHKFNTICLSENYLD